MQELYVADVDYEEAKRLADLTSIYQDLLYVVQSSHRLLELLKGKSGDRTLIKSLWSAALIAYARCFKAGKRFGLSENIFKGLPGEPMKAHQYYINLRDKLVAHSVNPFEQTKVGLLLSNPTEPERKVLGVFPVHMELTVSDADGVGTLLRLADFARRKVAEQAKEQETKVLEKGKTLPIDKLYSKPRLQMRAPGPEDAGRARK